MLHEVSGGKTKIHIYGSWVKLLQTRAVFFFFVVRNKVRNLGKAHHTLSHAVNNHWLDVSSIILLTLRATNNKDLHHTPVDYSLPKTPYTHLPSFPRFFLSCLLLPAFSRPF